MTFPSSEIGHLEIRTVANEVTPNRFERVIVSVELKGPPVVTLAPFEVSHYGVPLSPDGSKIQIGPYILNRISEPSPWSQRAYWAVATMGKAYWYYYCTLLFLDGIWRRFLLTLAVWGLANWPKYNEPTWADVLERWRKKKV